MRRGCWYSRQAFINNGCLSSSELGPRSLQVLSTDCSAPAWSRAQALEDPLNERFVLLSDSDLPLYPASLVWRQLMAEGASRSGACDHPKQASPRHALWRMLACWPLAPTAQWQLSCSTASVVIQCRRELPHEPADVQRAVKASSLEEVEPMVHANSQPCRCKFFSGRCTLPCSSAPELWVTLPIHPPLPHS